MRYLLPCLCFWWLAAGVTAQTTDGDAAGQWKKLGKEFQQKRQFDSSTYYLRMALPLFKKAEKWDEYYWLQQDIAYNYLDQGQPEAGLRAVQAAVDDLESRPPADSQLTVVLGDLYRAKGVIYYESGHYREAKSAYEQGLEVYRRVQRLRQHPREHRRRLPELARPPMTHLQIAQATCRVNLDRVRCVDLRGDTRKLYEPSKCDCTRVLASPT